MAIQGEGQAFELIRVPDGDRQAWLDVRSRGIGGSDVAALMGLSPYRTPYETWAEKSGLAEPEDISGRPAVMWGNILEPVVGNHYETVHPDRKVRRVNAVCRSIQRPWAQASLDYEVLDPDEGEWGVLEIKTASERMKEQWDEGVPLYYLTQVTHYMSVTGRRYADVAVLIGGNDYREYRVYRDEDDIASVNEAVDGFWKRVESGDAPDVLGTVGESHILFRQHKGGSEVIEDYGQDPDELTEYLAAKATYEAAKEVYQLRQVKLKQLIGDDKGFESDSGRVVWSRSTRTTLDSNRLKAEMPEVYRQYAVTKEADLGVRFYKRKVK